MIYGKRLYEWRKSVEERVVKKAGEEGKKTIFEKSKKLRNWSDLIVGS